MTIKDKVLELFESGKGIYFSGEEIAKKLDVSRAAVWKAVNALRSEGYSIDAANNRGYCMAEDTDILSRQGIEKYLDDENRNMRIEVFHSVDSTNTLVRKEAVSGADEGYAAIAEMQTAGRGRYGRNFYSPGDTGVYFSILLRPHSFHAEEAVSITTMAAAAMCEAVEDVSGGKPMIKWVNDIFMGGRKVCGILTEGSFGMESGLLEYAVLGAGVNLYPPEDGFPKDIEQTAGTVFDKRESDMKNRITAAFFNHFMRYYRAENRKSYIEKYKSYSIAIGRDVTVISGKKERKAFVYDMDDSCRLLVRYENGEEAVLSSGEIRIKL